MNEPSADPQIRAVLARLALIQDAQSVHAGALEKIQGCLESIAQRLSKIESGLAWAEKHRAERERQRA